MAIPTPPRLPMDLLQFERVSIDEMEFISGATECELRDTIPCPPPVTEHPAFLTEALTREDDLSW